MTEMRRGFASDNQAGAHPEVLAALAEANGGHAGAYGDDPWTAEAVSAFRRLLGPDVEVLFAFNGTGANCVGLGSVVRPWEGVVCGEAAHINVDECGAPERLAGCKLLPVAAPDGRLTPEAVAPRLTGFGVEHHVQPRVVSITNLSELGTAYGPAEVRALAGQAHEHGMLLHCDGARLANAVAGLGVDAAEVTTAAGVDVLTFGGTKNGMLYGEAVVFAGPALAPSAAFVRKQSAQLASKMRFVAAQFLALLEGGLWLRNAGHANAMARRLAEGARERGVVVTRPVDGNEVFALLPPERVADLRRAWPFYVWDEGRSEARWVCSWDTTEGDVDGLLALLD